MIVAAVPNKPKYPDPREWTGKRLRGTFSRAQLRQFQRDTVLACAEEVGHNHEFWPLGTPLASEAKCCPACKLRARAEKLREVTYAQ